MKPLRFVLARTLKNIIVDTFRRPTRLITYSIIAFLLIISAYMNISGKATAVDNGYLDIRILHGIYIVLLSMIGIPLMLNGLKSGTTFFSMCDVNMMFVSPINSKHILIYGLAKKAVVVLLVIVCYLTYGKLAMRTFPLNDFQAFMLIAGLAIFLLLVQVYTLVIYSMTNGNDKRINTVKFAIYGSLTFMVGYIALFVLIHGVTLNNIYVALSQRVLEYVPIIGWIKGMIFAVNNSEWFYFAIYTTLLALSVIICCVIFIKNDVDYYEDVLQNTESTYELRKSMREGKVPVFNKYGKTKLHSTGINLGKGASTFFFKHMREASRRSRMIFVNMSSLAVIGVSIMLVILMSNFEVPGQRPLHTKTIMATTCMLCVYIQFFMNAYGDWNRELARPYIYIVPASPLKKLICASCMSIIKPCIDGVLAFVIAGNIIGADWLTIFVCAALYGSFGFVFTTTNILTDRFLGSISNRGVLVAVYVAIIFVQTLPGVLFAAVVLVLIKFKNFAVLGIPVFIWNIISSLIVYIICKETLHDMDNG